MRSPRARAASSAEARSYAKDIAKLLKVLASEHRLLIMRFLILNGEVSVGRLVDEVGLGQSALSQHLAKLRAAGLVKFRRASQTLMYRSADDRAEKLLWVLQDMFVPHPVQSTET